MNNIRGNNRRRGRNNRSQGGGQHLNRIDSRARGNAPQLLDKYKKLAEEAHRNGDRVQAEYFLQFADHYFRVIADIKARQDEQRLRRDDDRGENEADENTDDRSDEGEEDRDERPRRRRKETAGEDNPFTRDNRQRRPRRDQTDKESSDSDGQETEKAVKNDGGLDPQALPPAIGEAEEKPKRRGRPRKVKAEVADDNPDVKQAVNS